jgi:ribose transport system ATP-binding protein
MHFDSASMTTLLKMEKISKIFGSNKVLSDINLEFQRGKIHALLGSNGAGKSTLCKIVAGLTQASSGSMWSSDHSENRSSESALVPFAPLNKQQAEEIGIQIVQQELNLIDTLDVAQNLFLRRLPQKLGGLDFVALYQSSSQVLRDFELSDSLSVHALVGNLGVGQRQMIEIAKGFVHDMRMIILDEPTAALSLKESNILFSKLRGAKEQGKGVVYISHRLEEVLDLCDIATILRDGQIVGTYPIEELSKERIVRLMTYGSEERFDLPKGVCKLVDRRVTNEASDPIDRSMEAGDRVERSHALLSIRGWRRTRTQDPITLDVLPGEIVGIAGLVGSGRSELLRSIYGADVAAEGTMELNGEPRKPFVSTEESTRHGLAMISEDRKKDGLLLSLSIADNITLPTLTKSSEFKNRFGLFSPGLAKSTAEYFRELLQIKSQSADQLCQSLSGGNQQKVIVAKWLARGFQVLLVDEPTRGIDVAARERIFEVFRQLKQEKKGILMVSSDLEELLQISDRIYVLSNNKITGRFDGPSFSRELITKAMFAGYESH